MLLHRNKLMLGQSVTHQFCLMLFACVHLSLFLFHCFQDDSTMQLDLWGYGAGCPKVQISRNCGRFVLTAKIKRILLDSLVTGLLDVAVLKCFINSQRWFPRQDDDMMMATSATLPESIPRRILQFLWGSDLFVQHYRYFFCLQNMCSSCIM